MLQFTVKERKGVSNVESNGTELHAKPQSKCSNCRGNYSANDRSCPRYKCELKRYKDRKMK